MASSIPTQIAETIQTAHINRAPSPRHDLNPETAADRKQPIEIEEVKHDELGLSEIDDDDIPVSILKPRPRRRSFPPLPDLRFEQSYLHSIEGANTWYKIAWVTVRDQMLMPFGQGLLYNLALCGWQHWNKNARIQGNSLGARLRRWWYEVNNWEIPKVSRR